MVIHGAVCPIYDIIKASLKNNFVGANPTVCAWNPPQKHFFQLFSAYRNLLFLRIKIA